MNPNFIPLESVSPRPFTPNFDLDSIQIASPCRADWGQMSGDDQKRHCQSCAKNVYNLSALTRDEATRLILESEGHLCVQLHRRKDGTLITADCPVGVSTHQKPRFALRTLFAAAVAALLGVFGIAGARAAQSQLPQPTLGAPMMGEMAPVMGKPQIVTPAAKKTRKTAPNHAKHVVKSSRKSGAPRHR